MKQGPDEKKDSENMKAGIISLRGFLGRDTRDLTQIIIDDDAAVKRMDCDHQDIAQKMRYFRDKGLEGLGEYITVDDYFEVKVDSVRGKLPSPFEDDRKIVAKTNITVRNRRTGRQVCYTDMLIHLVSAHGFYEGLGSPFRVSPQDLVEILEVSKNAN